MERVLSIVVEEQMAESVSQVGQLLKQQCGLTQKQISRLKFQENGILKNGAKCRVTEPIHIGDVIRICIEETHTDSAHIRGKKGDLHILYEDSDLLVVNKPAGVVTHPQGGHYEDTLVNWVQEYFLQKGETNCIRPVGRLDKETSGIVVFAKNRIAAARLQEQRDQGIFQKWYTAYVHGAMETSDNEYLICKNIGKDKDNPLKMVIDDQGKFARTHYRVMWSCKDWSIVEVWLDTGRMHQIRVHMAALGHSLLGDSLYEECGLEGQRMYGRMQRAALHAGKIYLTHPITGEEMEFEVPVPEDMEKIQKQAHGEWA